MKQIEVAITRKMRTLGWGYNPWTDGDLEPPSKPKHTGTIRQLVAARENDLAYQVMKASRTATIEAWFVKFQGRWYRAEFTRAQHPIDLLFSFRFQGKQLYPIKQIITIIEVPSYAYVLAQSEKRIVKGGFTDLKEAAEMGRAVAAALTSGGIFTRFWEIINEDEKELYPDLFPEN